jgi:hypothetical protein
MNCPAWLRISEIGCNRPPIRSTRLVSDRSGISNPAGAGHNQQIIQNGFRQTVDVLRIKRYTQLDPPAGVWYFNRRLPPRIGSNDARSMFLHSGAGSTRQ